jgi:hypothetical protein
MPALLLGVTLPVAWRLQWDIPGWHSRHPVLWNPCAFTVAGQWRSFTALPEHSVAGNRYRGTTRQLPKGKSQNKGTLQFVSHPVHAVKIRALPFMQSRHSGLCPKASFWIVSGSVILDCDLAVQNLRSRLPVPPYTIEESALR